MDDNAKKTALRMIPYGLYVLTADDGAGHVAASTVNWATQTSFNPPLVVVAVKTDSGTYTALKSAKSFALNVLGKQQQKAAYVFFKPVQVEGDTLSGEPFRKGSTGAPILTNAPAAVECKVAEIVERGDHHIVVGEVIDAHVMSAPPGRPEAATLELKDLGEKVFYGG